MVTEEERARAAAVDLLTLVRELATWLSAQASIDANASRPDLAARSLFQIAKINRVLRQRYLLV